MKQRETLGITTIWTDKSWIVQVVSRTSEGNVALPLGPDTPDGIHSLGNLRCEVKSFVGGKLILPSEATALCIEDPNQDHCLPYLKAVTKYRRRYASVVFHEDSRQCPTISFEEFRSWIALEYWDASNPARWSFVQYEDTQHWIRLSPAITLLEALQLSDSYQVDKLERIVREAKDVGGITIQIGTASLSMEVPRIYHTPASKGHDGGCELIFRPEGNVRCYTKHPPKEEECASFNVTLGWRRCGNELEGNRIFEIISVTYPPIAR